MSIQESASICNSMYKGSIAAEGEVSLDLYRPKDEIPRYTVYILDKILSKERTSFAIFIVPQGR